MNAIRLKKVTTLFVVALTGASLLHSASANAADAARETRTVSGPITSVRLVGPIDMVISQGETRGVIVEGEAKDIARIKIEQSGEEMIVRLEDEKSSWGNSPSHKSPRAIVALPDIRRLAVVGSGDVVMSAFNLNEGKLEIDVAGSGDVKLASLKAKALAVSIRGSGDVTASGQVGTQSVAIAGSGDYSGTDLQSQIGAVSVKGSGDAKIWATDTLSVSIAGSGDVAYRGTPKLQQSIAGSGEVHPIH